MNQNIADSTKNFGTNGEPPSQIPPQEEVLCCGICTSYARSNERRERLPEMVSSISPYDFEYRHDADKDMICRPLRKNRK